MCFLNGSGGSETVCSTKTVSTGYGPALDGRKKKQLASGLGRRIPNKQMAVTSPVRISGLKNKTISFSLANVSCEFAIGARLSI